MMVIAALCEEAIQTRDGKAVVVDGAGADF